MAAAGESGTAAPKIGLGGGRGAGQPAFAGGLVAEGRLEELPDDPERKLALELAAASGEHASAVLLGRRPQLGQEPALPDPGRPLDESEPALTVRRLGERRAKRLELTIALQQELCPSGVRHGAHPMDGPLASANDGH